MQDLPPGLRQPPGSDDGPQAGTRERRLIEAQTPLLNRAAAALEACGQWSLDTPMVLVDRPPELEGQLMPIGQLGLSLEHLPAALDGFVRRRQQGMPLETAHHLSLREGGDDFQAAWERVQDRHPLVCHDDLVRFAALCQKGFSRDPKQLLVVVCWPEQVSAFLLACRRQGPLKGSDRPPP